MRRVKYAIDLAAYYRSEAWQTKRREVYRYYGNRCSVCGLDWKARGDVLHAHHYHYWLKGQCIIGHEVISRDLCCLCSSHHPKGKFSKEFIRMWRHSYLWWKAARLVGGWIWSGCRWLWTIIARRMKIPRNR